MLTSNWLTAIIHCSPTIRADPHLYNSLCTIAAQATSSENLLHLQNVRIFFIKEKWKNDEHPIFAAAKIVVNFLKQKLQWYLVTQNPGGLGHLPDPCYWNRIWPVSFWRSGGWAADNSNTFPLHMSFTQLMLDYPGLKKENNFCFWQRFFWQVISQT